MRFTSKLSASFLLVMSLSLASNYRCFSQSGILSLPQAEAVAQKDISHSSSNLEREIDYMRDACRKLELLGIKIPRGGDYKEVEIDVGSRNFKTHAWVMSADRVICWNGQEYMPVSIGDNAVLAADIQALIAKDRVAVKENNVSQVTSIDLRASGAELTEANAVSNTSFALNKIPMLLMLNEDELAAQLWSEWQAGASAGATITGGSAKAWYARFAGDWIWSLYDRALCAHMRASDAIALDYAVRCKRAAAELTNEEIKETATSYLEPTLSQLIADQKRRSEKTRQKADDSSSANIDELIAKLDEVTGGETGQSAPYAFDPDPVPALVALGKAHVNSLIDCFENDNRLTRVVAFWRDFRCRRVIVPVSAVAYAALQGLAEQPFKDQEISTPDQRRQTAAYLRKYFDQRKGKSFPEQWYETLADDGEKPDRWLGAANRIVSDAGNRADTADCDPLCFLTDSNVPAMIRIKSPLHLRGEELRAKADPSVSDLLSRRAFELLHSDDYYDAENGVHLALVLALWDGKARQSDLARFTHEVIDSSSDKRSVRQFEEWFCHASVLCEARFALGDSAALQDYLSIVTRISPQATKTCDPFRMLWKNYSLPEVKKIADWLFTGDGSLWNPKGHALFPANKPQLWISALLALPPYRSQIIQLLKSDEPIGTVEIKSNGDVQSQSSMPGLYGKGYNLNKEPMSFATSAGPPTENEPSIIVYRIKDAVASQLSNVRGFPEFKLHWTLEQKDAAATKFVELFDHYGNALGGEGVSEPFSDENLGIFSRAQFVFRVLSAPASADQAARGEAIFSLDQPGEKKLLPVALPQSAQALQLNHQPVQADALDLTVWQAEELTTSHGTERYYGVVGEHFIGRLPAESVHLLNHP